MTHDLASHVSNFRSLFRYRTPIIQGGNIIAIMRPIMSDNEMVKTPMFLAENRAIIAIT